MSFSDWATKRFLCTICYLHFCVHRQVRRLHEPRQSLFFPPHFFQWIFCRKKVYAHLQTLGLNYFETAKTGDLSYRLTEDIDRIGEVINKFFHDFIPSALQLIVVFAYMFIVNWQLTIAVIIIAPLLGVLVGFFG